MAENKLADIKKFFQNGDKPMTTAEFKAEWDQLSEEEKAWFKAQPLEKGK